MIAAEQTFDGTWPYPARFTEAAGFRQHYVDEGPERPDHTIVMLHGEPTWGYEWRHLIGPLVTSPSGARSRPHGLRQERDARGSDVRRKRAHLESLLVDTLDLTDITLVVSVLSDQLETLLGRPPRTLRWALQNNTNLRQLTSPPSH
jgi:haloalkane dehalogenase